MIGPDTRLVGAAALWTAASVLVVFFPALWLAAGAALLLLAALAFWDHRWCRRLPAPDCRRELPERAFVRRAVEVGLALTNTAALPIELDVVEELPADLLPAGLAFSRLRLPPHATLVQRYEVTPRRRGDRELGTAIALVRSRFGFWRRRISFGAGDRLRVYPDVSRFLRPEALRPKRVLEMLGVRPTRRRGEGTDFDRLDDYQPGDDPRRVDWAATGRRGRLVVRRFQHERSRTVVVAVDASRLMAGRVDEQTKLDHAIDAALALVYAALTCGDRASLVVFDSGVRAYVAPRATRRHLGSFLERLRAVEPRLVEADYRVLARAVSARQRQSALLIVLTDFVEGGSADLDDPLALLARHHRVLLVAMRDREYLDLDRPPRRREQGLDLYRRLVLGDLLQDRETTLGRLRRRGLQTLDLAPEAVTASVLNRYLAMRLGAER